MYMVKVKQAFTLHWLGSGRPYIHCAKSTHAGAIRTQIMRRLGIPLPIVGPCELEYRHYSNEPMKICLELVPELA
jgi:hypothetical protein